MRPDSDAETWERREAQALNVVPYVLLAISLIMDAVTGWEKGGALLVSLGIGAVAGAWVAWFVTLHPGWSERPEIMAVYFAGLIGFVAVLDLRSPLFGFFTFIGYIHAHLLPGRWGRLAGVLATAVGEAYKRGLLS